MVTTSNSLGYGKYGIHIALVIVASIMLISGIWIWFGRKQSQIDSRLLNTHQFTNLKELPYETTDITPDPNSPGRNMDAFYINYYRAQPGE